MAFPEAVERWRPIVAKYFPPELVDKALYVIQHESGGNAGAVGDGGAARGLFQIQDKRNFANRPDAAYLDDPEKNIAYAAKELGAAGGNWGAWGEGTSYQGQKFGALGNNPYPGDTGGGTAMTQPSGGGGFRDPQKQADYDSLRTDFESAKKAWAAAGSPMDSPLWDAMELAKEYYYAFTEQHGYPSSDSSEAISEEVKNRISLGDFETRQADSAFKKWYDKYGAAAEEATQDYNQRADHNAANVKLQQARDTSQNPDALPYVTDAGYIEQSRSQLMDAYLKKMGISREAPTYAGTGLSLTGAGNQNGAGGLAAGGANVGPGPDASRNPWDARLPGPSMFDPGDELISMGQPGRLQTYAGQRVIDTSARDQNPSITALGLSGGIRPQRQEGGGGRDWSAAARFGAGMSGIPGAGMMASAATSGPAKGAGKKVKRWWQRRGFADGGQNIPAGPAWVGERGPEIMEVPGFGQKIVGQNGPEEMHIPEGANIIPVDEQFAMHQIQTAAREGPQRDRLKQSMEQRQRAQDPQLQEKVMAAMHKGMASEWAANPPYTPMLEPGVPDYWAAKRQLTGVPASMEEAMMQQEAAKKGAR